MQLVNHLWAISFKTAVVFRRSILGFDTTKCLSKLHGYYLELMMHIKVVFCLWLRSKVASTSHLDIVIWARLLLLKHRSLVEVLRTTSCEYWDKQQTICKLSKLCSFSVLTITIIMAGFGVFLELRLIWEQIVMLTHL